MLIIMFYKTAILNLCIFLSNVLSVFSPEYREEVGHIYTPGRGVYTLYTNTIQCIQENQ